MFSKSKAAKRQGVVSNSKEVEVGTRRSTEGDEGGDQYEKKEEAVSVTSQLCIKSPENSRNLDKQVVLRRIRHRKRMNKLRAAVGAILGTATGAGGDSSVQQKKWVDDAFAAL